MPVLTECTEEGKKVKREGRSTYTSVYRRTRVCVRADNLRFNTCNMHTVYMIYVHNYAYIILVISVKCKQSW